MRLHTKTSVILLLLLIHGNSALSQKIEVVPAKGQISVRDLNHFGGTLGLRSYLYDYELENHYCIHFWVRIEPDTSEPQVNDVGGLCTSGGSQRLTIQLSQLNDGQLQPHFFVDNLTCGNGGGISGPKIELTQPSGMNQRSVMPSLSFGEKSTFVDIGYFQTEKNESGNRVVSSGKRIVVLAELRPNPNKVDGTE